MISVAYSSEDKLSDSNSIKFHEIISGQINAIKLGNKKIAFSYASKNIKRKFINEEVLTGINVDTEFFWGEFSRIIYDFQPINQIRF